MARMRETDKEGKSAAAGAYESMFTYLHFINLSQDLLEQLPAHLCAQIHHRILEAPCKSYQSLVVAVSLSVCTNTPQKPEEIISVL